MSNEGVDHQHADQDADDARAVDGDGLNPFHSGLLRCGHVSVMIRYPGGGAQACRARLDRPETVAIGSRIETAVGRRRDRGMK